MMPDNPEIENMDPFMRYWMYCQWIEDFSDNFELLKNHGYLIGSFINPEAVKKALGKDGTTYHSDEEAQEKTLEAIKMESRISVEKNNEEVSKKKRKRKKIIG